MALPGSDNATPSALFCKGPPQIVDGLRCCVSATGGIGAELASSNQFWQVQNTKSNAESAAALEIKLYKTMHGKMQVRAGSIDRKQYDHTYH